MYEEPQPSVETFSVNLSDWLEKLDQLEGILKAT